MMPDSKKQDFAVMVAKALKKNPKVESVVVNCMAAVMVYMKDGRVFQLRTVEVQESL